MFNQSVKELSPEALGFIANLFDGQNYAIAVKWVAQRPVITIDPAQRLMNFIGLNLEWQIKLHPYLYWFHPKKPVKYADGYLDGKSDLELLLMAKNNGEELDFDSLSAEWRELRNKVERLSLIRHYVWARNERRKRRLAEALILK